MKKLILFTMLVAVILIGYIKYDVDSRTNKITDLPALPTSQIRKGTISSTLSGRGKITPSRLMPVNSSIEGQIKEILVAEGATVKKGQCLAKIAISPDLQARILYLKQKTISNDLKRQQLLEEMNFLKKLYQEGLKARVDIEFLEKKVEWNKVEEKTLENERQILEQKLGTSLDKSSLVNTISAQTMDACVQAVIDGTVLQISKYVDDIVFPEAGFGHSTILVIADLSTYYIDYNVSEIDLHKIKVDQQVKIIFDSLPESIFSGRVESISRMAFYDMRGEPFIDSSKEMSHYKARILVTDDISGLRPDLSCRIVVKTATRQDILLAPISSVFKENDDRQFVFIQKNGQYTRRQVHVGISNADMTEITSGLNENEIVYSTPMKIIEHEEILKVSRQKTFIEKLLH